MPAPVELHSRIKSKQQGKVKSPWDSGNGSVPPDIDPAELEQLYGTATFDASVLASGTTVTTVTNATSFTQDTTVTTVPICHKLSQTSEILSQTVTNSANYLETLKIWLETCDGEFNMQTAARELGWYENRSHYANFRKAVQRACELGLLARARKERGFYRKTLVGFTEMDIEGAVAEEFPIVLPLQLHKMVEVNPKEIILVAGESNAGKTAFIFNVLWGNINHLGSMGKLRPKKTEDPQKIGLRYFSSEMGPTVVKKKLMDFGPAYPIQTFVQNVTSISCNLGFQDILDPDGINCIDYLEPPNGDYILIAPTITEIFAKLNKGIAVIAIQKRTGTDVGRGGEGTLEKPRLALALSQNKEKGYFTAKITKAKIPRDGIGLDGKEIDFVLEKGVRIIPISDWGYADQHKKRRADLNLRGDAHGY